jgi:hypothetical protein
MVKSRKKSLKRRQNIKSRIPRKKCIISSEPEVKEPGIEENIPGPQGSGHIYDRVIDLENKLKNLEKKLKSNDAVEFGVKPSEQEYNIHLLEKRIDKKLEEINDKLEHLDLNLGIYLKWHQKNYISINDLGKEEKVEEVPVYDVLRELAQYLYDNNIEMRINATYVVSKEYNKISDNILERISKYLQQLFPELIVPIPEPSTTPIWDSRGQTGQFVYIYYYGGSPRFQHHYSKSSWYKDTNANQQEYHFWYKFNDFNLCKFVRENPIISFLYVSEHSNYPDFFIGKRINYKEEQYKKTAERYMENCEKYFEEVKPELFVGNPNMPRKTKIQSKVTN